MSSSSRDISPASRLKRCLLDIRAILISGAREGQTGREIRMNFDAINSVKLRTVFGANGIAWHDDLHDFMETYARDIAVWDDRKRKWFPVPESNNLVLQNHLAAAKRGVTQTNLGNKCWNSNRRCYARQTFSPSAASSSASSAFSRVLSQSNDSYERRAPSAEDASRFAYCSEVLPLHVTVRNDDLPTEPIACLRCASLETSSVPVPQPASEPVHPCLPRPVLRPAADPCPFASCSTSDSTDLLNLQLSKMGLASKETLASVLQGDGYAQTLLKFEDSNNKLLDIDTEYINIVQQDLYAHDKLLTLVVPTCFEDPSYFYVIPQYYQAELCQLQADLATFYFSAENREHCRLQRCDLLLGQPVAVPDPVTYEWRRAEISSELMDSDEDVIVYLVDSGRVMSIPIDLDSPEQCILRMPSRFVEKLPMLAIACEMRGLELLDGDIARQRFSEVTNRFVDEDRWAIVAHLDAERSTYDLSLVETREGCDDEIYLEELLFHAGCVRTSEPITVTEGISPQQQFDPDAELELLLQSFVSQGQPDSSVPPGFAKTDRASNPAASLTTFEPFVDNDSAAPELSVLSSSAVKRSHIAAGDVDKPVRKEAHVSLPSVDTPVGGRGALLLDKMGYVPGKGLGRAEQGRTEPVELSRQRGRRGLGHTIPGIEPSYSVTWDQGSEDLTIEETVLFIPACEHAAPDLETLSLWMETGERKETIDDEVEFCSEQLLHQMLSAKSVFDELPERDLRHARKRANPFETIRSVFFQNRAAMKMANLDAVLNFKLTSPPCINTALVDDPKWHDAKRSLFYFADVCGGPGGFTEYVLWRRAWNAHGFGFTLKGQEDFKLEKFLAASPEMFEPFYGIDGLEGDGDATNPKNLAAFQKFVLDATDQVGVHLFMADGAFSVSGRENIQEILSKRLYLCQFLCGLSILCEGGNLVCNVFDLFTPFSASLIYLLHLCFEKVSVHKPHTSRPANSERYVIGLSYQPERGSVIRQYLTAVNDTLNAYQKSSSPRDVTTLVPVDLMHGCESFDDYLLESNERLAARQSLYLDKYRKFAQNTTLHDLRQHDLRDKCLQYWNIPDRPRDPFQRPAPMVRMQELLNCYSELPPFLKLSPQSFTSLADVERIFEVQCVVSCVKPSFLLSLGKTFIYQWQKGPERWDSFTSLSVQIPKDTLLFVEITKEYSETTGKLLARTVVRIIDAYLLNGVNVSRSSYRDRLDMARKFAFAIRKNSRRDLAVVETVKAVSLVRIEEQIQQRLYRVRHRGTEKDSKDTYIIARGIYFVPITHPPWIVHFSKSQEKPYFFDTNKNASSFEQPPEAAASFEHMFTMQLCRYWDWGDPLRNVCVLDEPMENARLTVAEVVDYVKTRVTALTGR